MTNPALKREEKNAADVLLKLKGSAFNAFESRRSYEWKVNLAIWTALAVLAGFALRGQVTRTPRAGLIIAGLLGVVVLHAFFLIQVQIGHRADRKSEHQYENAINELLGRPCKPDWSNCKIVCRAVGWILCEALITLGLVAVTLAAVLPALKGRRDASAHVFQVVRVIDGETFVIMYDGAPTYVRIHGIDAPDAKVVGGPAATEALTKLIGGKSVYLEFVGKRKRDDLRQLGAKVYVVEADVAAEMVRSGHAVPYVPPAK